ncbi:MAG: Spo0B domain-containing protein [Desulfotomaculum sp.]|nr:Spo0B domain-containing protein [Desulfotomaculum sp.]
MRVDQLLDVIRVQRHDFLNHLQVISGLIQLNKSDKAKDYIDRISSEMKKLSAITKLEIYELKAVLLVAANETAKHQIEFVYDINSRMENFLLPGELVAAPLEKCIETALKELSKPELEDRCLQVSINEFDNNIWFKVSFNTLLTNPGSLESKLKNCLGIAEGKIHLELRTFQNCTEVAFLVPGTTESTGMQNPKEQSYNFFSST